MCAVAAVAVFASEAGAQAGIPIPCTGEKIVKVADMPKTAMPDGTKVDLGYMFQYCFTGKWVGYVGSDRQYLELPDHLLGAMAILAGYKELPPAPGFWASAWDNPGSFWVEWLWLGLLAIAGCGLISNKVRYGTFAHPPSTAPAAPATPTRATATNAAPVATAVRIARVLKPAGAAGTPTFGRR